MEKQGQEKIDGAEITVPKNKFLSWLDNFWYHYKWPTLIISFFLIVGILGFVQCSHKKTGDMNVAIAGGCSMDVSQRSSLISALNLLIASENAEDSKKVTVSDYPVFSDEEIKAMFTDENGEFSLSAYEKLRQQCVQNVNTFGEYIMTGECSVYLVRESVYKAQNMTKLAAPLSDYFDTLPKGAYDEYAVRIGDTAFYQYYEALHFIPEDTLLVLTKPYIYGASSQKEQYAQSEKLFLAILNFETPTTE